MKYQQRPEENDIKLYLVIVSKAIGLPMLLEISNMNLGSQYSRGNSINQIQHLMFICLRLLQPKSGSPLQQT